MIKQIRNLIESKGGIGKFIRYALVGGSAVIVDFAVFEILMMLLGTFENITVYTLSVEPEKIANTAAVISGFVYSFILNRMWAFKSKTNALKQFVLMLMLLMLNTIISNEAISFMGRNANIAFSIAKPIMQAAIAIWNYFIYDRIIYKN